MDPKQVQRLKGRKFSPMQHGSDEALRKILVGYVHNSCHIQAFLRHSCMSLCSPVIQPAVLPTSKGRNDGQRSNYAHIVQVVEEVELIRGALPTKGRQEGLHSTWDSCRRLF